ncbi:MAG: hypothetical protein PHC38_08670 [Weeksellaceae bacterium]|nr:hypothetical protein [Weeksellaceae bacterium]
MKKTKDIFLLIILFVSFSVSAQSILIPYKSGEKYGMLNEQNEVVIQPEFSDLEWLTDKYFVASQTVIRSEKIKKSANEFLDKDQKIQLKSLYYQDKNLIAPEIYSAYKVVPEVLIMAFFQGKPEEMSRTQAQYDQIKDKPLYFTLFDFEGNRVGEEFYQRLELIALSGKSDRNEKLEKHALFFVQKFDNQFDMFVYDADAKMISNYFFQNATQFKVLDKDFTSGSYFISYVDKENKQQQKEIKINSNSFELIDFEGERTPFRMNRDILEENQKENPIKKVELNPQSEESSQHFRSYYEQKKDSLVFVKSREEIKEIQLDENTKVFFKRSDFQNQTENLIYKKNNKYGWIQNGEFSETQFDSLAYFGNSYFLACQKNNKSQWKCGVLGMKAESILPLEYDELIGQPKQFEFQKEGEQIKLKVQFKPTVKEEFSPYYLPLGSSVFAYKNGKVGILKLNGTQVLPIEYDEIANNKVQVKGEKETQFMVLKKENLYGVIMNVFDVETKQTVQQMIEPVFPDYPVYYFKDYYGISGFNLFALYDENGKFIAFANEFSHVYKK